MTATITIGIRFRRSTSSIKQVPTGLLNFSFLFPLHRSKQALFLLLFQTKCQPTGIYHGDKVLWRPPGVTLRILSYQELRDFIGAALERNAKDRIYYVLMQLAPSSFLHLPPLLHALDSTVHSSTKRQKKRVFQRNRKCWNEKGPLFHCQSGKRNEPSSAQESKWPIPRAQCEEGSHQCRAEPGNNHKTLSIKGASGLFVVVASNFAPGTEIENRKAKKEEVQNLS